MIPLTTMHIQQRILATLATATTLPILAAAPAAAASRHSRSPITRTASSFKA